MLNELIKRYLSVDDDSRKVVNLLALSYETLSLDSISSQLPEVRREKIMSVLKTETASKVISYDNYRKKYFANISLMIWLFPLICKKSLTSGGKKVTTFGLYVYSPYNHGRLINYLNALCFHHDQLKAAEKDFLQYEFTNLRYLHVIFMQSAYDSYLSGISDTVMQRIYSGILTDTVLKIAPFDMLQLMDRKTHVGNPLNALRAELAIKQGDFEQAQKHMSVYRDEPNNYFIDAIFAFNNDAMGDALSLFEKGLKKQRRKLKKSYMPVIPEIAMFYIIACLSQGQRFYMSVFRRMINDKGIIASGVLTDFRSVCEYYVMEVEPAEQVAISMGSTGGSKEPGPILWKTVAMGLIGRKYMMEQYIVRATRQAVENKHYAFAYEAAYLLMQWFPSPETRRLFGDLSTRMKYRPAFSRIKFPDEWERQLNSFFTLEAVQAVIRKEENDGKSRVAYRFFPEQISAVPIVQTRYASGAWSSGRSIAVRNLIDQKVDCMTEQDRRIASGETPYSSVLGRNAVYEMAGHPHIFFKESNIPVELVAAQPVINVMKSAGNTYVMESDISDPREGISVRKETNTRYKIYNLTRFQCDIIRAVAKSKPVPEHGYGKLMQILKHFSMYAQVQSDLDVDDSGDVKIREVNTDSRICVQLLPVGEGLKAELFVKPFGSHPPYCKPGQGGKALIASDNGERVKVIRNLDRENEYNMRINNELRTIESTRKTVDGLMTFNNPLDALELLDILERNQDISIVEWPEGERVKIRKRVTTGDIRIKVKSNINWFELEGELKIDESTVITIDKLLEMLRNSRGRFVALSSGEFLVLSDQIRRHLSELAAYTTESKDGLVLNRFASASLMDTLDEFENIVVDKAWIDFRKRLQTVQTSNAPVPSLLQTQLRPYQISACQWMIRLSEWGAGACLADDMGLGKTVQTIAVLLYRAHTGAAMVVSPVSVMPNWISEVNRFAPSLNVKTLRNSDRPATLDSLESGDLLVVSYGLLLSEEKIIASRQWATVVLDEAHTIKNYNTKTSKAAMSVQADFRMVLTGTPIQNHLGEIWSLFQFINPGMLGSLPHFTDTFIRSGDENARNRLRKLIAPFILRRTKASVLEELPPKTEIIRKITLSDEEIAFYEMLRRKAVESLEKDSSPQGARHLKVLAEITRLRQACCSPSLVYPEISIKSTKLATFLEIASELKENGHRTLVFSQFVSHLSIVRKALDEAGYTYCYLDGATSVTKRESEMIDFQGGKGDFFLISLKAGGLGLNLTAADYVIHLDPWWNPAIEDQASDRAHRIGQNRPVTVYRLVAEHTIEEKIIQLHNTKRDLADSLLEGSDRSARMSFDELMSLIKGN
ncbi:MAG: DEAD/DEAH box helicase [Prevotellaceae bacterium]|jgi:SNF2 family DNA or RNA helicase|nr:DEAD/DEAH box helicase [Prevotellaceae bacterium]